LERNKRANPIEGAEWKPISTEVRIKQGLDAKDPDLVRRTKAFLDRQPDAPRSNPSKKKKSNNLSIFSSKIDAIEYCKNFESKFQEQKSKLLEHLEDINKDVRMRNALIDLHQLHLEGYQKQHPIEIEFEGTI